jgi:hypothetical protein
VTNGPTPLGHGVPLRGLERTPSSSSTTGRFGRMFRTVPIFEPRPESLVELGAAMVQGLEDGLLDKPLGVVDDDENTATMQGTELRLPAGYTYFGQFVDHDVTFDPVSSLTRQSDPDALTDFRTPRFDLDSLYGRGPADQPYLYQTDGLHLALGNDVDASDPSVAGPDLLRAPGTDRALTGDPRNDENLIVSQLQVAFLRFHNEVLDLLQAQHPDLSAGELFASAQRTVRWHYQWVVVHDFLVRLVGQEVVDDLLPAADFTVSTDPASKARLVQPNLRFFRWHDKPFMPVEFSVAAYRFGHSMARPSYVINDSIPLSVAPPVASRIPLFSQTGSPTQNLNGFRTLPQGWGVQWKYFLAGIVEPAGPNDAHLPQPSYKLDAELSNPLGALPASTAAAEVIVPGADPSVAQVLSTRNLLRGLRLGVPAGQDVARAMGITPLTDDQLFSEVSLSDAAKADLSGHAPLWFYILKEAEALAGSAHLGPVGGRLVAEVLIGLLVADPLSYLRVDPTWRPTLPARNPGEFQLSDLINLARPGLGGASPSTYGS